MSDPLRTEPSRATEAAPDEDREAKIEQLLLAGLDHYVGARYEHAINIWTRALFLNRSHARTRAYIERARSALAEGQRESEELLHSGVAAFNKGEGAEARRLLQAAMRRGAPAEEALAILDRLDRLESGMPLPRPAPAAAAPHVPQGARSRRLVPVQWVAVGALGFVIVGAALFGFGAFRADWRTLGQQPVLPTTTAPQDLAEDGPSLPVRGERSLARARVLLAGGRLQDALAALEAVKATDLQRAEADRLRSEIQRQLIALAPALPAAGGETASRATTP